MDRRTVLLTLSVPVILLLAGTNIVFSRLFPDSLSEMSSAHWLQVILLGGIQVAIVALIMLTFDDFVFFNLGAKELRMHISRILKEQGIELTTQKKLGFLEKVYYRQYDVQYISTLTEIDIRTYDNSGLGSSYLKVKGIGKRKPQNLNVISLIVEDARASNLAQTPTGAYVEIGLALLMLIGGVVMLIFLL